MYFPADETDLPICMLSCFLYICSSLCTPPWTRRVVRSRASPARRTLATDATAPATAAPAPGTDSAGTVLASHVLRDGSARVHEINPFVIILLLCSMLLSLLCVANSWRPAVHSWRAHKQVPCCFMLLRIRFVHIITKG